MTPSLGSFCSSPLWDEQQTWNTTDPDLTDCFQQTVLVWVPVIVLLLLSPIEVYFLMKSHGRQIPWTGLNLLKLFLAFVSLTVTVIELVSLTVVNSNETMDPLSEITAPGIQSIGLLLSLIFIVSEKRKGIQSSGVLFIYWLLLAIGAIVNFRTTFRQAISLEYAADDIKFMVSMVFFATVIGQLVLSVFSDGPVYYQYEVIVKNKCPMESASFLSKIFFTWFDGMIWKGFKRPLEDSDLWSLNYKYRASNVYQKFDSIREKQIRSITRSNYPPVHVTLFRAFGWEFIFVVMLKFASDLLVFGNPLLLKQLIKFVSSNEPFWHGYFFAVSMFFVAVCLAVVLNQYNFKMKLVSMRVRTALVMAIYLKALRLSNKARSTATVGQIVNLMSVDSHLISDVVTDVPFLWSSPIQIIISLYLIWDLLGPSTLAGIAVLLLMMPLNTIIIRISRKLQRKVMKVRDERIRMMNELLSGIKVLKLYAWEKSYYNFVTKIRNRELKIMKKLVYVRSTSIVLFQSTPILISIATFATYSLVDSANILDAAKAFVSLSLFNVMRPSLVGFPMVISRLIQALVSLQRINDFLSSDELQCDKLTYNYEDDNAISMTDGTFSWNTGDPPVLHNISFKIPKGFLAAVVGPVGAGKSSLLSSMLGELEKLSGNISVQGSVAFVPQLAWIQNATLKNNILFEKCYEKSFYDKVIKCCALEPDLKVLPSGDETEIGEKGINLSGGQKQRVSLARAVYNNADMYFLDDPLSAVDAHVGKELFQNVIGPQGLLKNKTRILVTHKVTILPKMDLIIVLNEGKCAEIGTFKELVDRKGAFADFLMTYFSENEEIEDEDLLELKETAISKIIGPIKESRSQSPRYSSSRELVESSKSPIHVKDKLTKIQTEDKARIISKEHAETGEVAVSVYLYYAKSIGITTALISLMAMILMEGCSVGSNLWLSDWSQDQPINGTQDPNLRDLRLGVYGVLGIGQSLLGLCFTILITLGTLKASQALHSNMLSNILKCPMSFFETTPIGRILNRFSKDMQGADAAVPRVIRMLPVVLLSAFSTLVVISISTPAFLVSIPVVALLYYYLQKVYIASSRQLKRLESVRRSPTYSHFSETLAGISTIRAYKMQDNFARQLEDKVDSHHCSVFTRAVSSTWIALRLEIIGNLVVFSAAIFAVLARDNINAGIVGLSVSYAVQLTRVLNGIIRSWSELETNIVSVERIKEYAEIETEAPWEIAQCCPPNDWPTSGSVVFQEYSTRYRKTLDLVLKKVSCSILGGEKVGIVGRTGAGKSSLIQALFRIIEKVEGCILIDDVDITQIGLHDLRSRLTVIPQDPVLFMGTLRINLDPFTEYTDDQIWKALAEAHLKKFVSMQKEGLEYPVAEGGENLSVGQRQLICLARALLRKSKILILDEATAAVDLETDDLIQATIRKEFADCTVLTIAHRLNTVMDSTRILVLEDGLIKEFDSPENLLQNKHSVFYSMAKDAGIV